MIDREKVIKGLDLCLTGEPSTCEDCPYNAECKEVIGIGPSPLRHDALKLLKELEAEIEPDCEHANHDGAGCLGYCGCEQGDEPIEACKQCEKYTGNICAEY